MTGSLSLLHCPCCVHGACRCKFVLFPPRGRTGPPFSLCFVCSTLLRAKIWGLRWGSWLLVSGFKKKKNKLEILSSIKVLQLSRSTVTQHCELIAEDLTQQLQRDIADCELDESTDTRDTAQLCVYSGGVYRYDWRRGAINITAHERTHAGRGHFSVIQKLYGETHQLPVCELCAILMAVCHLSALLLSLQCALPRVTLLSIYHLCIVLHEV